MKTNELSRRIFNAEPVGKRGRERPKVESTERILEDLRTLGFRN
jgi:hypothetical protein